MERAFGAFTLRIDTGLCVGFGDCIEEAEEVLELTDDGIVRFRDGAPASASCDVLKAACAACPVDALSLHDASGTQVAP